MKDPAELSIEVNSVLLLVIGCLIGGVLAVFLILSGKGLMVILLGYSLPPSVMLVIFFISALRAQ